MRDKATVFEAGEGKLLSALRRHGMEPAGK